jgi:iron complex outermembrane receptor protein
MRLDWSDLLGAQGLTASLFVKNLANKLYYTGGNPGAQDESVEAVNVAPPRMYGLILRYAF